MKVQIYNWAGVGRVHKDIEAMGFKHRQIVHGDVFELAKKFVELGNNIMILNGDGVECNFVLAIDTRTFSQR